MKLNWKLMTLGSKRTWVLLSLLLFCSAQCQGSYKKLALYKVTNIKKTEMLLVGDFVQNYIINGTLQQASGIVGYDPATDTFTSNFGGVKLSSEVYCTVLEATNV